MSVRKRYKEDGSFVWEFCITIQKKPRKQYRKSGFKTKQLAQEAEQEAIQKYKNKNISLNIDKTTFKDILKLFFEHIEESDKYQEGTISNYKGYYNNHLQDFYYLTLPEITPYFIQRWFNKASKDKSPYIINGCRKLCKAAFNYCLNMKMIVDNPFTSMDIADEPNILRNRFTIEELKNLIKICFEHKPQFFCIFTLAVLTGMRLGEYTAICVEDIYFDKNQVWVQKQYTRRELKERTKTKTSKRIADFPYSVGRIIKWHIRKNQIFSGFLFKGKNNRPVSPNWVNKQFDELLELAGYPKDFMRLHDLRGQYVDLSHTLGLPVVYTSRQVGHARTSTTNDIYSSIMSEVNINAKEKIEEIIFCEHLVSI